MPVWAPQSSVDVALRGACPRCGVGRLFHGLLTVHKTCNECGFDLRGSDPGDGPAVFVILGLGAVIMALVLYVELKYQPAIWVHLVLWVPLTFVGAVGMLRVMKAWLIAQQYMHRRSTLGQ
jgi:uncharacterized protein (DUF983 family)